LPLPTPTILNLCPNAILYQQVWLNQHGTPVAPNDKHAVGQQTLPAGIEPIDTIVCRPVATSFSGLGVPESVPIQLVELSLISVNPLTVTYGTEAPSFFNVLITEDGVQPLGSMDLTPTQGGPPIRGNTVLNSLPVNYRVEFVDTGGMFPTWTLSGLGIDFTGNTGSFTIHSSSIPTMTEWAILLSAGLLLTAGILMIRRRRHQVAAS
jgi:hypothetical protein